MATIRVDAISGKQTSYSIKHLDGTTFDNVLDWRFRWFIKGQTVNNEYGTVLEPSNSPNVSVIWNSPTSGNSVERVLCCEIWKQLPNGDRDCNTIQNIIVDVNNGEVNLNILDLNGLYGSEIDYEGYVANSDVNIKGPVKLTNQCHIRNKPLHFKVSGDEGITDFWWKITNTTNSPSSGYFVNDTDQKLGFEIQTDADVNIESTSIAKFINVYPVPPDDKTYYIKAKGADSNGNFSNTKYLSFKLANDNPSIGVGSYPSTINLGYGPITIDWILEDAFSYPEWFKIKNEVYIGQIDCEPIIEQTPEGDWIQTPRSCAGVENTEFTGPHWIGEEPIIITDKYFHEITSSIASNGKYKFTYIIELPYAFNDNWIVGDPDRWRIILKTKIWDPELDPDGDSSCFIIKELEPINIKLNYCPNEIPFSDIKLYGPDCAQNIDFNNILFRKFDVIDIVCPPGQILTPTGCNWPIGSTLPCIIEGQYWDGVKCVCPPGYEEVDGECIETTCPTGSTNVDGECICDEEGMIMDTITGECICDENVYNNPCLECVALETWSEPSDVCEISNCYGIIESSYTQTCYNEYWVQSVDPFYWEHKPSGERFRRYTSENCPRNVSNSTGIIVGDTLWYSKAGRYLTFDSFNMPIITSSVRGISGVEYYSYTLSGCAIN